MILLCTNKTLAPNGIGVFFVKRSKLPILCNYTIVATTFGKLYIGLGGITSK